MLCINLWVIHACPKKNCSFTSRSAPPSAGSRNRFSGRRRPSTIRVFLLPKPGLRGSRFIFTPYEPCQTCAETWGGGTSMLPPKTSTRGEGGKLPLLKNGLGYTDFTLPLRSLHPLSLHPQLTISIVTTSIVATFAGRGAPHMSTTNVLARNIKLTLGSPGPPAHSDDHLGVRSWFEGTRESHIIIYDDVFITLI